MIPVKRATPQPGLTKRLQTNTSDLKNAGADIQLARKKWKGAKAVRRDVLTLLNDMAPGIARCMYCGDSQGTDIDHFKPIAEDPYLTFTWLNHLLACSYCNSNEKRDRYPCDPGSGQVLLIDPTIEDPHDHIRLNFATGQYSHITDKGKHTIDVFGLFRPVLEEGRKHAFIRCKAMLRDRIHLQDEGQFSEAEEVRASLQVQPFADVLYSMIRRRDDVGAATVFGPDIVMALRELSF